MVQMLFFIKFRGQLRRTRPELITSLEDTVANAAFASGGSVETGRKVLGASFDEGRIGFWLDMVIFLERVHKALEEAARELYGYALVLGRDIPEASFQKLCRSLSGAYDPGSTGIWLSREAREALEHYLVFDRQHRIEGENSGYRRELPEGYSELRDFRSFDKNRNDFPYREKIMSALAQGNDRNTVLLGPEFLGKMDGISHYCEGLLRDIPPLVVRFGAGYPRRAGDSGRGVYDTPFPLGGCVLVCFADAYTPRIRSFITGAASGETTKTLLEDLDAAHDLLFRERLREEWSPYIINQSRCFIRSLLIAYTAAVKSKNSNGVLILEDLSLAGTSAADIFKEVYFSLEDRLPVLATDSSSEESFRNWGGIFPRILKFSSEDFSVPERADLPREHSRDLWELAYSIFLFGQYFPAYLFPQLFEEEGLSRDMYFRALEMLASHGVVTPDDPRPRISNFASRAEKILADRKEKVRFAVRDRILAWVLSGRLRPCFNFLKVLSDLGEGAGDVLILKSLKADVHNGTCAEIEEALAKKRFASLVGAGNAPVLNNIYKTLKALVWGDKDEIQRVFLEPAPALKLEDGRPCYGGYQAQVQTNLAAFHIGSRNFEAASEVVRNVMLINRDLGEDAVPVYRLFSLVNLSRQRLDDALEYISFAVEQAERTEQREELFLACYFASSINFLYGNLSKAEQSALRSEQLASELGQAEWSMRARFLRGRLCFETGRYRDALDIFESLDSVSTGSSLTAMARTVRAWAFRTRNFLGRFSPFEDSGFSAGLDAEVFAIEAAYLATDYERAVTLADRFLSSPEGEPKAGFLYTEQPDWTSGFSQCEYMLQPGKAPGTKLAWVYRAMAQCALHPDQTQKAEILGGMQRFMREEPLPDTDPNDSFYFYAWYCMLRDVKAAQVDMNTVVSMAYKRLQRRAERIDDAGIKQTFLNLSRWNNTLGFAAREYKLV